MKHLHKGRNFFITTNHTSVEGFTPVEEGALALHEDFGVVQLMPHENEWVYQRLGYAGFANDLEKLSPIVFKVTKSANDMPAIELKNPAPEIREFILQAMRENRLGHPAYEARSKASAFLQSNSNDYLLIEFWNQTYKEFIEYLNTEFEGWYKQAMESGLLEFLFEK